MHIHHHFRCTACGCPEAKPTGDHPNVVECTACHGVHGNVTRTTAAALVGLGLEMQANAPPERMRYFDFDLITGRYVRERSHGWYDAVTQRVVQYG